MTDTPEEIKGRLERIGPALMKIAQHQGTAWQGPLENEHSAELFDFAEWAHNYLFHLSTKQAATPAGSLLQERPADMEELLSAYADLAANHDDALPITAKADTGGWVGLFHNDGTPIEADQRLADFVAAACNLAGAGFLADMKAFAAGDNPPAASQPLELLGVPPKVTNEMIQAALTSKGGAGSYLMLKELLDFDGEPAAEQVVRIALEAALAAAPPSTIGGSGPGESDESALAVVHEVLNDWLDENEATDFDENDVASLFAMLGTAGYSIVRNPTPSQKAQ